MFHHFHNGRHPKGQGSISKQNLERLLNFVGIDRILNPQEWLEKLEENRLEPENVCLTFDDALRSQFEVALPVLEKYHLKAFWFIYSSVFEGHSGKMEIYRHFRSKYYSNIDDFYELFFKKIFKSEFSKRAKEVLEDRKIKNQIEQYPFYSVNDIKFRLIRDLALGKETYESIMDEIIQEHGFSLEDLSKNLWMSNHHLKYLSDTGHVIGLHSYSHPTTLAELSYKDQLGEYEKNYHHIKKVCGQNPQAVAHPCNSYNENTIKILKQLDIRCGFRSNMFSKEKGGQLNATRFEIAREDHANVIRMWKKRSCKSGEEA